MSHPKIVRDGDKLQLDLGDEKHELESSGPSASVRRVQSRQQVPQVRSVQQTPANAGAAKAPAKVPPQPMQQQMRSAPRVNVRQQAIDNTNPITSTPAAKVGQSSVKKPSKFKQEAQAKKASASAAPPNPMSVMKGGIMERSTAAPMKQIVATTPAVMPPVQSKQPRPLIKPVPMPAVPSQAAAPRPGPHRPPLSTMKPIGLESSAVDSQPPQPQRVADFEDDASQIKHQNLQQVLQMSDSEMKEAMDSIASLLSPQMLEYLRSRQPSADVVAAVQAEEKHLVEQAPLAEPIDLSSIETEDDLLRAATNLPEAEKQKLAWTGMFESDTTKLSQHDVRTAASPALQRERFDLHGQLLGAQTPTVDADDTELYHHEDKPTTPGYTLVELCELARSQVSSQRIIALRAIHGVLRARARSVLPASYNAHTSETVASELPVELPAVILYSFGARVTPQVAAEALLALNALLQCLPEDAESDAVGMQVQSYVSVPRTPFIPNPQMSRTYKHEDRQTYEYAESFALQRVQELVKQADEPEDNDGAANTPPIHELLGLLSRHHLVEGIMFSGFLNVLPEVLRSTPLGSAIGSTLPIRATSAALNVLYSIARSSSEHAEHIAKNVVLVLLKKSNQFFDLLSPSSSVAELKLPILQLLGAIVQSSRAGAMLLANKGLLDILPAVILHSEGDVTAAALRLLKYFLVYGVGLPTVADTIELLKDGSSAIRKAHDGAIARELLACMGFTAKLDDAAVVLELLQVLDHTIPALAQALAKLMDGNHKPGVAHKPVTFAVGDIRLHESVLQRLSGHVLEVSTKLCGWAMARLQSGSPSLNDVSFRSVLNVVATTHTATSAAVDQSTTASFVRVAGMYAGQFLKDGDFQASIELFASGWNALQLVLAPWLFECVQQLEAADQSPTSVAGRLLVARLLPLLSSGQAAARELRPHLMRYVKSKLEQEQHILTKLEEGVQLFVLRRVDRIAMVYFVHYLLRFGELSPSDQLQLGFQLLRILAPGDEAFAVQLIENVCFGAPLQSSLGSASQQELVRLRSLYSAAICDQETLQHSQAIALRLCFQLTSQRCCPPGTSDNSMLPLPNHWLLLPLTGSGTSAQMTSKVIIHVLQLLVMMQEAQLSTYLELPTAAVIFSLMCAALALQATEVPWSLEAHGMAETVLAEDTEALASTLIQKLLMHQLSSLYQCRQENREFTEQFRTYVQQGSNMGKKMTGPASAGRRAAPVNTVLDFTDELLARLLSSGWGESEMFSALCAVLLLPQMHWTVQERALLEIGKAGQLDLLISSVLDSCVAAWLAPNLSGAAVDAVMDAISATYSIAPARLALIQNTVLYPMCLHVVAHAIDGASDASRQKQAWYRLDRLGDVDFAVDAVYYAQEVYQNACVALQSNEVAAASDTVKQVWKTHGLLPYMQRSSNFREQALQLIESKNR